jgi:PadR family transcriptional regulator PadR
MMNTWITQLRKGLIEYCVMKRLSKGESYGYEIVQRLKEMDELVITESIVYPILSRLRKEGHLKVRAVKSPDGPPRRYYDLTSLGNNRVKEMDAYWKDLCRSVEQLDEMKGIEE